MSVESERQASGGAAGGERAAPTAEWPPRRTPLAARFRRRLLRVPLFYKILIANALIVMAGTVIGTLIERRFLQPNEEEVSAVGLVLLLALVGVATTVLVNALILRVALRPLKLLELTAARVQSGDLHARVPPSAVSDRELERLTGTFNGMLDNLETFRQRLREVAARALNAEEEERKRIARELHDDTAQTLAALMIRLRVARAQETAEAREQVLEQFRGDLAHALERIRRFARGLRPPALDELGLVPALESHVRTLSEQVGVAMTMEAEPLGDVLTPQAELALYRISQEAISNSLRHSGADQVEIRIARVRDAVVVRVSDDGVGFPVMEIMGSEQLGLGLFGMQERAAYVGGRVEIESAPGGGTRVTATIPIDEHTAGSTANRGWSFPRRLRTGSGAEENS